MNRHRHTHKIKSEMEQQQKRKEERSSTQCRIPGISSSDTEQKLINSYAPNKTNYGRRRERGNCKCNNINFRLDLLCTPFCLSEIHIKKNALGVFDNFNSARARTLYPISRIECATVAAKPIVMRRHIAHAS